MPTTFANMISLDGGTTNLPIYADRAEKDAAGNSLQTTYATKSELATGLSSKQDTISDLATIRSGAAAGATAVQPGDLAAVAVSGAYADLSGTPTINNVPAVTSSDDNKVLKASYSGGAGSYSWQTESGGTVTDVEVDGTSVVSGGVASITMPTELVPAVGSSDNAKVLTAAYDSDTGTGSYSWKVPEGLFVAIYGTSTYAEVHAAVEAGKIVYCSVSGGAGGGGAGRMAFLAYRNPGWNYEFQYYRSNSSSSGTDSVFVYKLNSTNIWETTQRDVKAGNISYPVTNVKVNGSSVMSGTVANITLPTIPVTDVEVDGTSVVNASGVAEITMPTELVPTVTSSDNNKVLKASYSGGVASYSWQNESGGGGGSYTAGTGIDITNDVISVDTSTVAMKTDIPSVPVTDVTVDGVSVVSNGTAAVTMPSVDQTYDGTSTNAQSGVAVASAISGKQDTLTAGTNITISNNTISATDTTYTAGTGIDITNSVISADTTVLATKSELPDGVPAVTSSDDDKVLKAAYSGGVGSYSWEAEPTILGLTAGSNVTITETNNTVTIAATDTTYTAGNMIAIDANSNNAIGVSTTAGITDIQLVNALPASPVATVLYIIPET